MGDRLWLVVADAPLDRFGSRAIERGLRDLDWVSRCALAHEAVVEDVARRATVVPMKLFTLFASDERALRELRRARPSLGAVAQRLEGCEEWGVRVYLSEPARPAARKRPAPATGTAFLRLKKAQQDSARDAESRRHPELGELYRALAGQARKAQRRRAEVESGGRLVLDAVYLVEKSRQPRFVATATRAGQRLATSGLKLTLTGPWPAYHFVGGAR
jgi:gas vesicle protein GvpL/GvpF